jgi:hypothetical protein
LSLGVICFAVTPAVARTADGVDLIVLMTSGDHTQVKRVRLNASSADVSTAPTVATLSHVVDGAVRAAVAGDGSIWVMTEENVGRNRSFSGALSRVSAAGETTRLRGGLAYASSPLIVGTSVFIQTGARGVPGDPRRMRDDDVAITMLDTEHPDAPGQVIVELRGQLAYPIGVDAHGDLIAYLIGPAGTPGEGGRLAAIALSSLSHPLRDLGAIGTARDLSYTARLTHGGGVLGPAIVFESPRENGRHVLRALLLDSASENRQLELGEEGRPLAPRVDAQGAIHVSELVDDALEVPRVLFNYKDDGISALQRYQRDRPLPALIVRDHGGVIEIAADVRTRLEPVGFVRAR